MHHRARSSLLACGLPPAALAAGTCASSPGLISSPRVHTPTDRSGTTRWRPGQEGTHFLRAFSDAPLAGSVKPTQTPGAR